MRHLHGVQQFTIAINVTKINIVKIIDDSAHQGKDFKVFFAKHFKNIKISNRNKLIEEIVVTFHSIVKH